MFSYLHKYCVLSLNCFLLTGVCLSLIPFITREPSNISPLILTPFLDFHLFHFESKSRGFPSWRSIILPSCLFFICSLYQLLLFFEPCLILPCISSLVLSIPFIPIYEDGLRPMFSVEICLHGIFTGVICACVCPPSSMYIIYQLPSASVYILGQFINLGLPGITCKKYHIHLLSSLIILFFSCKEALRYYCTEYRNKTIEVEHKVYK